MSYKISDGMKILDIGRDQLFYWIKTKKLIKPEIEGKGRGARSRLSKKNIFELAVIKELSSLGVELNFVEEILNTNLYSPSSIVPFHLTGEARLLDQIYDWFKGQIKGEDFLLTIYKDNNNRYQLGTIGHKGLKELSTKIKVVSIIILNLSEILRGLDEKAKVI